MSFSFGIEAKLFKYLFEPYKKFSVEVPIKVTENGLVIATLDVSRISLLYTEIPKEVLFNFNVKKEIILSVDPSHVLNFLKKVKDTDVLLFESYRGNKLRLSIASRSGRRGRILPLLLTEEFAEKMPKIPETWKGKVVLSAFTNGLMGEGDEITIVGEKNRMLIYSADITGLGDYCLLSTGEGIIEIDCVGKVKSTYVKSMMYNVCKLMTRLTDVVKITFSTNTPIRMEFQMPYRGMVCNYYLAPRMV